jgi:hypothetical protein
VTQRMDAILANELRPQDNPGEGLIQRAMRGR